jgi:glucose-6-phosphate isomerase
MKMITETPEWQALNAHQKHIAAERMQDWFANDALRFSTFSIQFGDILLDYSKNWVKPDTIRLLCQLAQAANLSTKIGALFHGQPVNSTERRPALHTALRSQDNTPVYAGDQNVIEPIQAALAKMREFVEKVRQKKWLGSTGLPISDIVNIGIGGSHLGPLLTTHALADYATDALRCHFISNIDTAHIHEVLARLNPETTLFIISSKSFTTLETLTNAKTIQQWLEHKLGKSNLEKHWVAVTANLQQAMQFGIPESQIFPIWDWVGGRYSIWSAIGLPLALSIGMDHFLAFLAGANAMDQHFRHAEWAHNMPVMLGLLSIWYINFFAANNQAIIPYSHYLKHLHTYLQQTDMESNGKRTSHAGAPIDYATGPILWGEQGCNGQHAFHQLLHQGQHLIPVDFILIGKTKNALAHHHDILVASGLSQAQALMQGKTHQEAFAELRKEGYSDEEALNLAQHKVIPGNRPSNVLFINQMTPYNLGALLALYEHKIFVQSAIWDINPFDQWGVELGKQLLPHILTQLNNQPGQNKQDSSTQGLIRHYNKLRCS